jgi:hypothetical protein
MNNSVLVDTTKLEIAMNQVLSEEYVGGADNPDPVFVHKSFIVAGLREDLARLKIESQDTGDTKLYVDLIDMSSEYILTLGDLLRTTNAYAMLGGYESGGPKDMAAKKRDTLYIKLVALGDDISSKLGESSKFRSAQNSLVHEVRTQPILY